MFINEIVDLGLQARSRT